MTFSVLSNEGYNMFSFLFSENGGHNVSLRHLTRMKDFRSEKCQGRVFMVNLLKRSVKE